MNIDQAKLCREILESLIRRPVSRLFWDYDGPEMEGPKVRAPVSLRLISDRLLRGLYVTPDAFVADMRTLFSNAVKRPQRGIRSMAAVELAQEFENLMGDLGPTPSGLTAQTQGLELKLRRFLRDIHPGLTINIENTDREPGAEIVRQPKTEADVNNIAEDIRNLFSPSLLLRVIAFIYSLQPEAVSIDEEEIVIEFLLLTDATLQKLREFLNKLIRQTAQGKINPFVKGASGSARPAFVNEVL